MRYRKILAYLPNGVRESARQAKVSHSTMSRLKRGMMPDLETMLTLMEGAQATEITFTRSDLVTARAARGKLRSERK